MYSLVSVPSRCRAAAVSISFCTSAAVAKVFGGKLLSSGWTDCARTPGMSRSAATTSDAENLRCMTSILSGLPCRRH
ncbi:MAG: hypothetical protein WDN03_08210 [Rhizomicrobium sp.]